MGKLVELPLDKFNPPSIGLILSALGPGEYYEVFLLPGLLYLRCRSNSKLTEYYTCNISRWMEHTRTYRGHVYTVPDVNVMKVETQAGDIVYYSRMVNSWTQTLEDWIIGLHNLSYMNRVVYDQGSLVYNALVYLLNYYSNHRIRYEGKMYSLFDLMKNEYMGKTRVDHIRELTSLELIELVMLVE